MTHFVMILKLCVPQAIRITMSSKPNLWHQNLSFTIRLFFHATYEVTKPKGSEFLSFAAFIRRFISPLRFCIFSSHRRLATRRW